MQNTTALTDQEVAKREQRLLKRVERERIARKEAERLLEGKSLDLFLANRELQALNKDLEQKVAQRTAELSAALLKADQLAKIKQQFLATMSHELRTPMNAVIGFSDILLNSALTKEQTQLLSSLQHSGHHLLNIINDILAFANYEAEKIAFTPQPTNLTQLADELINNFALKANSKQLNLVANLSEGLPKSVLVDTTRLKQVLFHLLSNAIKFTDQGEVRLTISATVDNQLLFEVTDTGIGIADEAQSTLFEAFTQVDNQMNRQYQGTGIGLALSAKIIDQMHSKIQVESQPNHGSRFFFSLPIQHTPENTSPNDPLPTDDAPAKPTGQINPSLRVLITDDNPVNLMLAIKLTEKLGIRPQQAKDGLQAVELLESETFDLIFMDVQMPIMDGLEATRFIRKLGDSIVQPRIIALTANAFAEDRHQCFAAGMDAFLSKPITFDAIKNQILHEQSLLTQATGR